MLLDILSLPCHIVLAQMDQNRSDKALHSNIVSANGAMSSARGTEMTACRWLYLRPERPGLLIGVVCFAVIRMPSG